MALHRKYLKTALIALCPLALNIFYRSWLFYILLPIFETYSQQECLLTGISSNQSLQFLRLPTPCSKTDGLVLFRHLFLCFSCSFYLSTISGIFLKFNLQKILCCNGIIKNFPCILFQFMCVFITGAKMS